MKGDITVMKSTHFDDISSIRLPKKVQRQRLWRVIDEELTPIQREVLIAYYFQDQNMTQIARERGVHKSTVCRTLHRAEKKLRQFLKY